MYYESSKVGKAETEFTIKFPSFSDRYVWENSVDPDQEQSDQSLPCLLLQLHLSDTFRNGKAILFKF